MLLLISNRHLAYLVNNNLKNNLVLFYSLFLMIFSLRLIILSFAYSSTFYPHSHRSPSYVHEALAALCYMMVKAGVSLCNIWKHLTNFKHSSP